MAKFFSEKPYAVRRIGADIDTKRIFNIPGPVSFLFSISALVFTLMVLAPRLMAPFVVDVLALSPEKFLAGPGEAGFAGMIAPLVTHMFVHANIAHILFNSLWLLALGTPVARRMGAEYMFRTGAGFFRSVLFVAFFVMCGVAGGLLYVGLHGGVDTILVGASGGVSGLLGGLIRFAFNRSTIFGPEHAKLSPLNSQPVIIWSTLIIGMNIAVGLFGDAVPGGADNVAWDAHIGGYLFGLLFYPLFDRAARGATR